MILISILFLLAVEKSFANNSTVTYGPTVVELDGTLELQTFPGPPRYESIEMGDVVERHFYLRLSKTIDVLSTKTHTGVENAVTEKNVRILQLSIAETDTTLWRRFRELKVGQRVAIAGTMFHRFNGHHHSRVLMSVNKMKILSDQ